MLFYLYPLIYYLYGPKPAKKQPQFTIKIAHTNLKMPKILPLDPNSRSLVSYFNYKFYREQIILLPTNYNLLKIK